MAVKFTKNRSFEQEGSGKFLCNFVRRTVFNWKQIMKHEPQHLRESLWRRKLTPAEHAELRSRPEIAADLELESRLSEMLAEMPDASVPSNFTTRLMQAVEMADSRPAPRWNFNWNWHRLLPRLAVTAAAILVAGLTFRHFELASQRSELVKNVALVTGSQPLPSVDALKNFDTIRRMSQPAHADEELLALMQ